MDAERYLRASRERVGSGCVVTGSSKYPLYPDNCPHLSSLLSHRAMSRGDGLSDLNLGRSSVLNFVKPFVIGVLALVLDMGAVITGEV